MVAASPVRRIRTSTTIGPHRESGRQEHRTDVQETQEHEVSSSGQDDSAEDDVDEAGLEPGCREAVSGGRDEDRPAAAPGRSRSESWGRSLPAAIRLSR